MIFVTVGTHEQQFNRLIKFIDELKRDKVIVEDVIMQTGFCTYQPKYCEWHKLISYKDMEKNVRDARIVITHGGPASFIMPLQIGKVPIVVPRQEIFHEHVNNHQVDFAKQIEKRMGTIIPIYNIEDLINDENKRLKLAENAKKWSQNFDVIKICDEWERLFKQVL